MGESACKQWNSFILAEKKTSTREQQAPSVGCLLRDPTLNDLTLNTQTCMTLRLNDLSAEACVTQDSGLTPDSERDDSNSLFCDSDTNRLRP